MASTARAEETSLTANAGVNMLVANATKLHMTRITYMSQLAYRYSPETFVKPYIGLGVSYLNFGSKRPLTDEISTDTAYATSPMFTYKLGLEAGLPLTSKRRYYIAIFGDFERSLGSPNTKIERSHASLLDEKLDQTEFLRDHSSHDMGWKQWNSGFRTIIPTRVRLGNIYLAFICEASFGQMEIALNTDFDEIGSASIESLGRDPETVGKGERKWMGSFLPGILMHGRAPLSGYLQALIAPIPQGWAFGLNAGLNFGHVI